MWNYPYYNYSSSPFGGLFSTIVWIVVIFVVISLIMRIFHPNRHIEKMERIKARYGIHDNESALDILKKRYAKGEITKREFDEMREHIS